MLRRWQRHRSTAESSNALSTRFSGYDERTRTKLRADAIEAALNAERERAAKIAEAEFEQQYPGVDYGDPDDSAAYRIAVAIRGKD